MADVVPPDVRSRMMAGIRSVNTKPELILRGGLHRRGFRFRLHDKTLPGKPDLVFPKRRAVLFAHGCFWHGHDCHLFHWPKSREEFWRTKIERNRFVDARSLSALLEAGWRYGIVWECALKGAGRLPADQVISACAAWIEGDAKLFELRGLSDDASRSSV
jgi:DNA mismatch endonuclease (patch repair protein)